MSVFDLTDPLPEAARPRPRRQGGSQDAAADQSWIDRTIDAVPSAFRVAKDEVRFVKDDRLRQAYNPVLRELEERTGHGWLHYQSAAKLINPFGGPDTLDKDAVWRDVAAIRAREPDAFKGVGRNRAAFEAAVIGRAGAHDRDAATAAEGGIAARLIGGAGAGLFDPRQDALMLVSGGATAGLSAARAMLVDAASNAGGAALMLPENIAVRKEFGEDTSVGDMVTEVAAAGLLGAAVPAAFRASGVVLDKAGAAAGGAVDRVAPGFRPARAMQSDLARMSDSDLARAFENTMPTHLQTPEEAAALAVVRRNGEVEAASPFEPSHASMAAHKVELDRATIALDTEVMPPPRRAVTPPARRTAGAGLSPERIIQFVQNDLEGGAAVVHYGAVDGGTTKYGIAAGANPGVDVANLTASEAARIAKTKYWFRELDGHAPEMQAVAFDAGYISGPEYGRKLLRESGGDPARALDMYREHLRTLAEKNPAKTKYLKGWMHRVDRLERFVGQEGGGAPEVRTASDGGDMVTAAERDFADAAEARRAADAQAESEGLDLAPEPVTLRRDLFPDETSWRVAQATEDARASGGEPAVTRQSVWAEARDRLMADQGGEVAGALYHREVGPIDVKWGDENGGLAKIAEKHPEVLPNLPELIDQMGVKSASENRVILQSLDHRAVIRLDYDGQAQKWLLSAYKVEGKAPTPADYRGAGVEGRDRSPAAGAAPDIGAAAGEGNAPAVVGMGAAERTPLARRADEGGAFAQEASASNPVRPPANPEAARVPEAMPPQADIGAKFDQPGGEGTVETADSLWHDIDAKLPEDSKLAVDLGDGRGERSVSDIREELEAEHAAIEAIRGCL